MQLSSSTNGSLGPRLLWHSYTNTFDLNENPNYFLGKEFVTMYLPYRVCPNSLAYSKFSVFSCVEFSSFPTGNYNGGNGAAANRKIDAEKLTNTDVRGGEVKNEKIDLSFCKYFKPCETFAECWCCVLGRQCYFTEEMCEAHCPHTKH